MKKLLFLLLLLVVGTANAQFTPGQLLTASALNTAFAGKAAIPTGTCLGSGFALNYTLGTGQFSCNGAINAATLGGATFQSPGPIGSVSPSTASFTSLTANGTLTFANGTLSLAYLATQAANTVVANVTGSTASPTAFAMPSCSAANSALQYTSGTGFTCFPSMARTDSALSQFAATTSAQLAGVLSDETGTGVAVFGTSPTINTPTISGGTINNASVGATTLAASGLISPTSTVGIKGTTTNDSAQAGSDGEVICAQVTNGGSPSGCATNSSSPVSLTTATAANITSVSLTAGHWDVCGEAALLPAGSTTITGASGWISTTSATLPTGSSQLLPFVFLANTGFVTGQGISLSIGCTTIKLASTTTVYVEAYSAFATSTMSAYGWIIATRRR